MLDLFAIVVTSVAIWLVLVRALQLDRSEPWYPRPQTPTRPATTQDNDLPVWRRKG